MKKIMNKFDTIEQVWNSEEVEQAILNELKIELNTLS